MTMFNMSLRNAETQTAVYTTMAQAVAQISKLAPDASQDRILGYIELEISP